LPKRPEISVKDFGRAIELEPTVVIDFDAQLFGTAANNGQMVEEVSDTSKAAEAFRSLADFLTDRSEQKSERQFDPGAHTGPLEADQDARLAARLSADCFLRAFGPFAHRRKREKGLRIG
jgi:hypothetical protein